jgi:hypothetical protein
MALKHILEFSLWLIKAMLNLKVSRFDFKFYAGLDEKSVFICLLSHWVLVESNEHLSNFEASAIYRYLTLKS